MSFLIDFRDCFNNLYSLKNNLATVLNSIISRFGSQSCFSRNHVASYRNRMCYEPSGSPINGRAREHDDVTLAPAISNVYHLRSEFDYPLQTAETPRGYSITTCQELIDRATSARHECRDLQIFRTRIILPGFMVFKLPIAINTARRYCFCINMNGGQKFIHAHEMGVSFQPGINLHYFLQRFK